jgi:hypothetical protein
MKRIKISLVLWTALFCSFIAKAQTAEDIIAKNLDAMGGKNKIGQVKSIYTEGTVQVMGNDNPTSTTILNGIGIRSESEFNGQKFIQVFTDKGGWMINPFAGGSGAQPLPDDAYKAGKGQIYIGGPFYDYAAKRTKIELLGKDGAVYKLKVTTSDSVESTYYVDPTTYYITKLVRKGNMQGQEVEVTINFSNYQKTDFGLVVPHSVQTDMGGTFQLSATITKVVVNKDVDPKIFDMPKS